MTDQDLATGERFIPEVMGGGLLEAEHHARYRLALPHVRGRRVLDAGCGVGWGSRLLLEAGAASVLGVDVDRDAIDDARQRVPGGAFAVADILRLPVAHHSIDVIVCFEALEHVSDHHAALDSLVLALRPGGLLFVSSPNPDVYPPGNPFHVHELRPAELVAAVGSRLAHTRLFHQVLAISSHLRADRAGDPAGAFLASGWMVGPGGSGHDPYALVVAGASPLPAIDDVQVLAPSDQLDHLDAAAIALAAERRAFEAQQTAVVAEREKILLAIDDAESRLVVADAALRSLSEERDRAVGAALRTAAERDRLGADLVAVEQALARKTAPAPRAARPARPTRPEDSPASEATVDPARFAELAQEADALRSELEAVRRTVSWRVTAPLRAVRRRIPR